MGKLSIKKSIFSIVLLSIFLVSFKEKKNILKDLKKRFNVEINKEIDRIYFIDENNIDCLECVLEFEKYIDSIPKLSSNLILINNVKNIIERNNKINSEYCILTYDNRKYNYEDFKIGILYLTNKKIDSFVNLTPYNFNKTIEKDYLKYK